jgi:hypothetical protein
MSCPRQRPALGVTSTPQETAKIKIIPKRMINMPIRFLFIFNSSFSLPVRRKCHSNPRIRNRQAKSPPKTTGPVAHYSPSGLFLNKFGRAARRSPYIWTIIASTTGFVPLLIPCPAANSGIRTCLRRRCASLPIPRRWSSPSSVFPRPASSCTGACIP